MLTVGQYQELFGWALQLDNVLVTPTLLKNQNNQNRHMGMNVYFTDPVECRVVDLDKNLVIRNTEDGYKISFSLLQ